MTGVAEWTAAQELAELILVPGRFIMCRGGGGGFGGMDPNDLFSMFMGGGMGGMGGGMGARAPQGFGGF